MDEYTLDELDIKILNLISNDARISFLEVSRIAGVSGAAVHQRVQKMTAGGIIIGSGLKLDMERIGYQVCAWLGLGFDGTHTLNRIAEDLSIIPQIVECHTTMGDYDFMVKIYARSNAHLLDIIRRQIKPLGAVRVQVSISCAELFRRQMTFHTNRAVKK
jgi:Lrp/AsnC family transcriptional regulator for asnA, asnC and gidA